MKKGAIIEDIFAQAVDIQMHLEDLGGTDTVILSSYADADHYLAKHRLDFIITDIVLDGHRKVFDLLEKHQIKCPIVFLTAYADDNVYQHTDEFNRFIFLVKPIQKHTLLSALNTLLNTNDSKVLEKVGADIYFVKVKKKMVPIPKVDIVFLSTEGNYCTIHTADEEYLVRFTLGRLIEAIGFEHLVRIHRNYAVNVNCVMEADFPQNLCRVYNVDQVFPMGRTYKKEFKLKFKS